MHTLDQLRSGALAGIKRLNISAQLELFPEEIYSLAESLEVLDLSNNALSTLPDDLHRLHKLKVLFCSENNFEELPTCIGLCSNLEMVGFKANSIQRVSAESLPPKLRWLILTDNQIETLPEELGQCDRLQKLMLAGNKLHSLPDSLSNCRQLQLLRVSANRLVEFPERLLSLPKLAWLAFSGNPFCSHSKTPVEAKQYALRDIAIGETLGQGASGVISRASWLRNTDAALPREFAIKVFKGQVTSDGYPADELNICLRMGEHHNLVNTFGFVAEEAHSSALMHLIPDNYQNLGLPPSLESCTRDQFGEELIISLTEIDGLVTQMESVVNYLHTHKIAHGDIYAHNVLINDENHLLFGDFGASSDYSYLSEHVQQKVERIEKRALGYFIDDLLCHYERLLACGGVTIESPDEPQIKKTLAMKAHALIAGEPASC